MYDLKENNNRLEELIRSINKKIHNNSKVLMLNYSNEVFDAPIDGFVFQSIPPSEFFSLTDLSRNLINQLICERFEYNDYYIIIQDLGPILRNIEYYKTSQDYLNELLCVCKALEVKVIGYEDLPLRPSVRRILSEDVCR